MHEKAKGASNPSKLEESPTLDVRSVHFEEHSSPPSSAMSSGAAATSLYHEPCDLTAAFNEVSTPRVTSFHDFAISHGSDKASLEQVRSKIDHGLECILPP